MSFDFPNADIFPFYPFSNHHLKASLIMIRINLALRLFASFKNEHTWITSLRVFTPG